MPFDARILFAPIKVSSDLMRQAAATAFAGREPANLAVLYGNQSSGPKSVCKHFKEFTTISLWGDCKDGFAPFRQEISKALPDVKVVTVMVSDRACTGGWEILQNGEILDTFNTNIDDDVDDISYCNCGATPFQIAYGANLGKLDEEVSFVRDFFDLERISGVCIYSEGDLDTYTPLSRVHIKQVFQNDLDDAIVEAILN